MVLFSLVVLISMVAVAIGVGASRGITRGNCRGKGKLFVLDFVLPLLVEVVLRENKCIFFAFGR